jgi:hypothetical protein
MDQPSTDAPIEGEGFSILFTSAWMAVEIAAFFAVSFALEKGCSHRFRRTSKTAAYEIAPQIVTLAMVYKGLRLLSLRTLFTATRKDRLYSQFQGASSLMMMEMAHCVAESILTLFVRDPDDCVEILVHHGLVFIMVATCFSPYANAYMPVACGVFHIVDLTYMFVNVFKCAPKLEARFPRVRLAFKILNLITFFAIRLVLWLPLLALFMMDNLSNMLNGTEHNTGTCLLQMVGGIILTYFQVVWFIRLIKHAIWKEEPEPAYYRRNHWNKSHWD